MSACRHCSAPVDRRKGFCDYCRSRVEMDLHGGLEYRLYEPESERTCPDCDIALTTIDLKIDGKFLIEKCQKCKGLFFDPGELEMILDRTVTDVFHVDHGKLNQLQTEHFKARGKAFRYRKCPACGVIMNRQNFGYKSGVILDRCKAHGFWLDEGELRQLQEWKKAGGELRKPSPKPESESLQTSEIFSKGTPFTEKYSNSRRRDLDSSSGILDLLFSVLD